MGPKPAPPARVVCGMLQMNGFFQPVSARMHANQVANDVIRMEERRVGCLRAPK